MREVAPGAGTAAILPTGGLDLQRIAGQMLDEMARFASGLLLKTSGGSLAQELLGSTLPTIPC